MLQTAFMISITNLNKLLVVKIFLNTSSGVVM